MDFTTELNPDADPEPGSTFAFQSTVTGIAVAQEGGEHEEFPLHTSMEEGNPWRWEYGAGHVRRVVSL